MKAAAARMARRLPPALLWLAGAAAAGPLGAQVDEPRAYGWRVGDVLSRSAAVEVPDGLELDESSLPQVGRQGQAFELRRVVWDAARRGGRHRLSLEYQIFLSPPEVRTLELPPVVLRFGGRPRAQELRIDAWPVTVAPLVPVAVSPRRGLGELQPDAEPPPIDIAGTRQRLWAYAAALASVLVALAWTALGPAWAARHARPFETAWRQLNGTPAGTEPLRAALRLLHEALNRSAGAVLFEPGLAAFLTARPGYAPLRDDLVLFFRLSRREFFGDGADAAALPPDPRRWLLEFCRRCRDVERGTR
jgi:mxaA protein